MRAQEGLRCAREGGWSYLAGRNTGNGYSGINVTDNNSTSANHDTGANVDALYHQCADANPGCLADNHPASQMRPGADMHTIIKPAIMINSR